MPISGLHAHQKAIFGDAGIVDKNIDSIFPLHDLFNHRFHLIFVGDVGLQAPGFATGLCSGVHQGRCRRFGVGIIHDNGCPCRCQFCGDRGTDTPAGTRYQGGLASQGLGMGH